MLDTIGSNDDPHDQPHLVFEWMDHDLLSVSSKRFRGELRLSIAVSKAVLSALEVFHRIDAVHTGISLLWLNSQY